MIDDLINGISVKLYELFGDGYDIEIDELPQGFAPPGFWITALKQSQAAGLDNRYRRKYHFDVLYYPRIDTESQTREISAVAEALLLGLEYITAGGNLVRGTDISYEVQDNVLHFFITFDLFVEKVRDKVDLMGELVQTQHLKG